ncbi:MAG: anaerobic sulfatase maturase [Chloroflexi bacterium]|nr:anaerobic sulfatase maturase [Chloroflexota bacterium]
MPHLPLMFKTVSTDCNLDCTYCYYRQSLEGTRVRRRVQETMLSHLLPEYMDYVADVGVASFGWQGGEPTLMGLDFFRRLVALQERAAKGRSMVISNALQTNATLVDDEWARFFADFQFLIGVSLDGPEWVHDVDRRDRGGHGTFRRVMSGIDAVRRAGVDLNILCVVGPHNVGRASELLAFYRQEGLTHLQFIPAMDFQAMEPERPPAYLITPEEYGEFLEVLFDEWYGTAGAPSVSIRIFNNFLQSFLGIANDLCVHGDRCDAGLVIEHNGDVYPCDFFIDPRWKLGNVLQQPLSAIASSADRRAFIGQKQPLPQECARCEYVAFCKGGCPRNRLQGMDNSELPDYFCASYKRFFAHASGRLRALQERMVRNARHRDRIELSPAQRPADVSDLSEFLAERELTS